MIGYHLTYLMLIIGLLYSFQGDYQKDSKTLTIGLSTSQTPVSECMEQTTEGSEVISSRILDVDQDSSLDEVVIYEKQGEVYVLLALNELLARCNVVLDEKLTSIMLADGNKQTVDLKSIELVELTGDTKPELHIWLDESGGGPRISFAVHAVYTSSSDGWQKVFHLEQCHAFNSFRFQDSPTSTTKDIYRDTDVQCVTPFSQSRTYDIWHWDGASFVPIENGTINTWSMYPPIWYVICISVFLCPLIALLLVYLTIRKVQR